VLGPALTAPLPLHACAVCRFMSTFRYQFEAAALASMVPLLGRLLSARSFVVHSYAAACLDKFMLVRAVARDARFTATVGAGWEGRGRVCQHVATMAAEATDAPCWSRWVVGRPLVELVCLRRHLGSYVVCGELTVCWCLAGCRCGTAL
jgi:hypothetical protein